MDWEKATGWEDAKGWEKATVPSSGHPFVGYISRFFRLAAEKRQGGCVLFITFHKIKIYNQWKK